MLSIYRLERRVVVGIMGGGGHWVIGSPLGKRNKGWGGFRNEWRALYVFWLSTCLAGVMLHGCYCYPHFPFRGNDASCLLAFSWKHYPTTLVQYVQYIRAYWPRSIVSSVETYIYPHFYPLYLTEDHTPTTWALPSRSHRWLIVPPSSKQLPGQQWNFNSTDARWLRFSPPLHL